MNGRWIWVIIGTCCKAIKLYIILQRNRKCLDYRITTDHFHSCHSEISMVSIFIEVLFYEWVTLYELLYQSNVTKDEKFG